MREGDQSIFVKPPTYETPLFPGKNRGPARFRPAVWAAAAALGLLTACAGPYVDSRREAGQKQLVGASTPDMVAICFAPAKTPRDQVLAMAQPLCAKTGRTAVFDHEDPWSCTLLTPTRGFYRCTVKP
jgi:hypothetical protein